ncbi:hypothetical protein B0H16DRAFT_1486938 [Mycena metata]|uniref:Uncharacterized protein n=1 Tax=Mycena metata TaxID=1033252 RepID=A0AAD7DFM5_9AGAR|nr:hypothetical protein B0H16DRAFT_1486938 [Mycena metata]
MYKSLTAMLPKLRRQLGGCAPYLSCLALPSAMDPSALTPAEIEGLLQLARDSTTIAYFANSDSQNLPVAALSLLVYDHLLSLDDERRRKSLAGYIYGPVTVSVNSPRVIPVLSSTPRSGACTRHGGVCEGRKFSGLARRCQFLAEASP